MIPEYGFREVDVSKLGQTFIGVDPGKSGAIVVLPKCEKDIRWIKGTETEADIADFMYEVRDLYGGYNQMTGEPDQLFAVIELLNPAPNFKPKGKQAGKQDEKPKFQRGSVASFKLGMSFGVLRGTFAAHRIRREFVLPRTWQTYMGCLSRGDKKITKSRAQELFPNIKVTHAIADALLLAEYARRKFGKP